MSREVRKFCLWFRFARLTGQLAWTQHVRLRASSFSLSPLRIASCATLFWQIKETCIVIYRCSKTKAFLSWLSTLRAGVLHLKVFRCFTLCQRCLNEMNAAKRCINLDGDLGSQTLQGSWCEHSMYGFRVWRFRIVSCYNYITLFFFFGEWWTILFYLRVPRKTKAFHSWPSTCKSRGCFI